MYSLKISLQILSLFFVFLFIGCSQKGPEGLPKLVPCKITVTQTGAPLEGAAVMLFQSGSTWIPMGTTNQSGVAELSTNGRYQGAPLGKFKILVSKTLRGESKIGPEPALDSPSYAAWVEKSQSEIVPVYTLVDPLFNDAAKTALEIEISTGKENTATVDVGKAVKIQTN